jgi:NAD(P)-dependent dehydrogenase (short-subunit alcohol dehydrogenase family)
MSDPIRTVLVLGAGTMGHGIAHVCAQAGCQVRLFDVKDELAQAGIAKIRANLDKGVEKGKVTAADRDQTLARLSATSDLATASKDIDLCVEAVPESLGLCGRHQGAAGRRPPGPPRLGTAGLRGPAEGTGLGPRGGPLEAQSARLVGARPGR